MNGWMIGRHFLELWIPLAIWQQESPCLRPSITLDVDIRLIRTWIYCLHFTTMTWIKSHFPWPVPHPSYISSSGPTCLSLIPLSLPPLVLRSRVCPGWGQDKCDMCCNLLLLLLGFPFKWENPFIFCMRVMSSIQPKVSDTSLDLSRKAGKR